MDYLIVGSRVSRVGSGSSVNWVIILEIWRPKYISHPSTYPHQYSFNKFYLHSHFFPMTPILQLSQSDISGDGGGWAGTPYPGHVWHVHDKVYQPVTQNCRNSHIWSYKRASVLCWTGVLLKFQNTEQYKQKRACFPTNLYLKYHHMCIQVLLLWECFETQFNLSLFLSYLQLQESDLFVQNLYLNISISTQHFLHVYFFI